MERKSIQTFCQNCHMKCRIFANVVNGKIESLRNGMGVKCDKFASSLELIYHPDRLLFPLKKARGQWRRTSWDAALTMMAEEFGQIIREYGPEAIATIRG